MKIKKMINDTVGVSVGAVGISEANKIDKPYGNIIGTTMSAGLVNSMLRRKK